MADAELVTSELVGNAVAVASRGAGVDVRLGLAESRVRIEVDDDGPGRPAVRTGTEHGGFGLQVVEALSECWGTDLASQHKTVWAVLPVA
jgi:phosphoserine phosphatase RsbU/P